MTILEHPRSASEIRRARRRPTRRANVGQGERAVSLAAGSLLALFGARRRTLPGALLAGVGGLMIYRGATGRSTAYDLLQLDRVRAREGIRVEEALLVQRPAEELYRTWRDLEGLPRILSHLKSVTVSEDGRSHWVAEAPRLAGGRVEWDAEITRDEPDALIAWRSLPGSEVESQGEVRFASAPGDRGTTLHVVLDYRPPAGRLGSWIATLAGTGASRQIRDDLRRFKCVMEVGEAPTVEGQPRGTCLGGGRREKG